MISFSPGAKLPLIERKFENHSSLRKKNTKKIVITQNYKETRKVNDG